MPAAIRPTPVSGLAFAAAAGAAALLVVALLASGGVEWWAAVAGGFACASGLVVGGTREVALGVALGMCAVTALALAVAARDDAVAGTERMMVRGDVAGTEHLVVGHDHGAPSGADRAAVGRAAPEDVVRHFYADLDAGAFRRAWATLSPGVQRAFGGFAAWRRGYATTLGHRVEHVRERGGVVRHVLVAVDRTPCGGRVERRFLVRWRLTRDRASALTAVKLGGPEPAEACP